MIDISKGRYWDFGWQLISSCTRCSPGCDNCWSLAKEKRLHEGIEGVIEVHPERLNRPLKRKKPAVYAIWNDLFHPDVPITFIDDVFEVIAAQHTFLILTKRAHLMEEKIYGVTKENGCRELGGGDYLPNVFWGLTVCTQQEADEKIPIFLQVPGKKFLSIEPMLEPIDLTQIDIGKFKTLDCLTGVPYDWDYAEYQPENKVDKIDAVILGGETLGSRPGRKMEIEWVESIVEQCRSAHVPLFIKQLHLNGNVSKDINEWPEYLRKRDLPWVVKQI